MTDVVALKAAGESLAKQSRIVRDAILANQKGMWCFVPTLNDPPNSRVEEIEPTEEDFISLASTLSNVWMGDEPDINHHGLLVCGLDEVLQEIRILNEIKQQLITSTDAVKHEIHTKQELEQNPNADSQFLEAMAKARAEFINKNRDFEFHTLLKRIKLPEMNFKKARKIVRVLEPEVQRVSYTWSKNHYRKSQIDTQAIAALSEYYSRIGKDFRSDKIREAMESYRNNKLFRVTFGNPVLRINFKHRLPEMEKPEWSSCLASGITVVAQKDVPIVVWKAPPSEEEVLRAKNSWLKQAKLTPVELDSFTELYRNAE